MEEKLQLEHGNYLLKSLQNRLNHREYILEGSTSEEFRVTLNGKITSGASGEWTWISGAAIVLAQGEIGRPSVSRVSSLRWKSIMCFIQTPASSVNGLFKNRSDGAIALINPYLLSDRLWTRAGAGQTLSYMTGGGSFSGSQVLSKFLCPIRTCEPSTPPTRQNFRRWRVSNSMVRRMVRQIHALVFDQQ